MPSYTIQAGDTLSGIGAKYGVDYNQIAKDNGISNPNLIQAGATLNINVPGGGSIKTLPVTGTNYTPNQPVQTIAPRPTVAPTQNYNPAPVASVAPQNSNRGFGSWLQSHGYNDPNVIAAAVANPSTAGSAYQDYLRDSSGGATGANLGQAPTLDLNAITAAAYNTPEIQAATKAVSDRQQALADAQAGINDNPFYAEATRVGKSQQLTQEANNDISVQQNTLASLKADAAIKVNAALGQYNIQNQAYQQKLQQFNNLVNAGALANMSGADLAAVAADVGIPVSELQGIQATQQKNNTKTALVTSNNGQVSVIDTSTGKVLGQTPAGVGAVTNQSGNGLTPYQQLEQSKNTVNNASSILDQNDTSNVDTRDRQLSQQEKQQAFNQVLALVGGNVDNAKTVFAQAWGQGGYSDYNPPSNGGSNNSGIIQNVENAFSGAVNGIESWWNSL